MNEWTNERIDFVAKDTEKYLLQWHAYQGTRKHMHDSVTFTGRQNSLQQQFLKATQLGEATEENRMSKNWASAHPPLTIDSKKRAGELYL